MSDTASSEEERFAAFSEHRKDFYALIGHLITRYQCVEDYLPKLFGAALGGDSDRATAIFNVVRGLEAKLSLISAALLTAEEHHQKRWSELLKRVAAAAAMRNQVAHASPVHNGGHLTILVSDNPDIPSKIVDRGPEWMELRKQSGKNETIWKQEVLHQEYNRTDDLFKYLIGFAMQLRGEVVPPHLLE